MEVTDNIFSSLDENKFVLLVLLDFSKAFDTVNHEILLAILQHIGLTHNSLALMSSYLRNRMQTVHLDNNYSQPAEVSLGVPQGSVLAPMLFSIYTHAFSKVIKHGTFHFYADDSQLQYTFTIDEVKEISSKINDDLDAFANIASSHGLILNPGKSKLILFGRGSNPSVRKDVISNLDIKLNGTPLNITECARNLGLLMDSSLGFTEHVTSIIQRSYFNLKKIYSIKNFLNFRTKVTLCELLVLSNFNYALRVWSVFKL